MTVPLIRAPLFASIDGLVHGFTTRQGGVSEGPFESLNLGESVGDDDDHVAENFRRVADQFGTPADRFFHSRQVHGADVVIVEPNHDIEDIEVRTGDALLTDRLGILLRIYVADCYPILLVDAVKRCIGLVHAGWRGTLARILPTTIAAMVSKYHCRAEDLYMALGPGISRKHFPVSSGIASLFKAELKVTGEELEERENDVCLDLAAINVRLAREARIRPDRIWVSEKCTFSDPTSFFSHRRDGKRTGRMTAVIGWSA